MNEHALEVLEFARALERVAAGAASEEGKERILALRPGLDREGIVRELARVGDALCFVAADPLWGMPPVPPVRGALAQLSVEGTVLEPVQLHRIGVLLASSRRLSQDLSRRSESCPGLDQLGTLLYEHRGTEEAIDRAVDGEGHVLDGASPELKRIRSRLRGASAKIVRKLEGFLSGLADRFQVPDGSVTVREGRYVVPVRREGKGDVGGIVHDESRSGATLFVEPPMAIEMMNALRDLEREERREIRRVLGALTESMAPHRDALAGSLDALVDFDVLHARARTARAWGAESPEIAEPHDHRLRIRGGRHPLLLGGDTTVVPFDLELDEHERALVVSGPNTGGKSVFLKATGLICALAQSGVFPPVGRGTRLPVFRRFFADIGDGQSISESLSTFSAHVATLSEIVRGADETSLVLIDEMGTGTDPAEGAALSRAVLELLVEAGATTIASSHLGALKRLDGEGSGIVNASLQFDSERMEPTYRLIKGRPGRSYGLAIARRMGLPDAVLDRAEAYRGDDEAHMESVLARLETQEREATRLVEALDQEKAETARLRDELDARERVLRTEERDAGEQARVEARKMLMDARAEVEAAIQEVRTAAEADRELDEVARAARRRVEDAARRHRPSGGVPNRESRAAEVSVGDRVRIRATGAKGTTVEVRSGRALVEVGALRIEVSCADLEPLDPVPAPTEGKRVGGWSGPQQEPARPEVDLRGLRVHELELELARALDAAAFEDLGELRIIHGKGTGALRQRVGELLQIDGRISDFRMGGPLEGGAGVTVATFGRGA